MIRPSVLARSFSRGIVFWGAPLKEINMNKTSEGDAKMTKEEKEEKEETEDDERKE